jgi:hypothetical protein
MQLEPISLGNERSSNRRRGSKIAVAIALSVLLRTTTPAAAYSMSDRFNDDFGDTPAHVDVAPMPAPQPVAAPKPKLRRAQAKPVAPTETDSKLALLPTGPADPVGERSPALAAIKPLAAIPNDNNIHITWNPGDLSWDGMFVANGAARPLTVLGIVFNNNKNCELRPYRMTAVRKSIDLPQAIKVWGESAINLFGLPKLELDEVIVPDLSNGFPSPAMQPDRLTLKPGARIPIYNGTKCDTVTEAAVETDKGTVPIRFKAPYSGH